VGIALFVGIAGNVDFGIGIVEFWSFHFLGEVSCVRERRQAFSAFFCEVHGIQVACGSNPLTPILNIAGLGKDSFSMRGFCCSHSRMS
jgi:hypothetical protein